MEINHSSTDADVLAAYQCDCNASPSSPHLSTCALWACWEFETGWAVWDHDEKKLVDYVLAAEEEKKAADAQYDLWRAGIETGKGKKGKKGKTVGGAITKGTVTTGKTVQKCRHYQQEVVMPDGTILYASSSTYDRKGAPIPDLGIYLDGCWKPDTIAFHIGCPDYNIPYPTVSQVLWIAGEGIRQAREGRRVEVGCIGGHGRTGLMLAIMATVINPAIDDAVKYIQTVYCKHAVESEVQEWYVAGIKCELAGKEWPEKPVYVAKYSGGSYGNVKWKYEKKEDMPDHFTKAEVSKAWSEHADDCPCSAQACKARRKANAPMCSVCNKELFAAFAIEQGRHSYCKPGQVLVTSTIAQPCNTGRGDKCRCYRCHPLTLKDCSCHRCIASECEKVVEEEKGTS